MRHERVSDEVRELAALHALGLLDPEQARAFQEHVDAGCAVCAQEVRAFQETAALLPYTLPEAGPGPHVREKLLAQIQSEAAAGPQVWKRWDAPPAGDLHVVRSRQGEWQETGVEGVSVKQLYVDPVQEQVTMLVRMAPGSKYPGHRHGGAEQCFVLEGDLRVGDLVLRAGDYQCAAAESIHTVSSTEQGCLLLIVSSQHDQLLA